MTTSAVAQLPKLISLKRTIQRIINLKNNSPPEPKSLTDLVIPMIYQVNHPSKIMTFS